ncbi:MAG: hypothetical protein ACLPX9_11210 [Rhodomicrobium sp.]
MKRTFAAAAVFSLATAAAANAAEPTVWQGDLFITPSSSCTGINAGYFGQAIYAPLGMAGNGKYDNFAVFEGEAQAHLVTPTTEVSLSSAINFNTLNISNRADVNQGSPSGMSFTISPAPSAKVQAPVTVTISISDYSVDGNTFCPVTLSGTLVYRPGKLAN